MRSDAPGRARRLDVDEGGIYSQEKSRREKFMEQSGNERELSSVDREIVSTLLETGAVNFEAIGNTIAKVGPQAMFMEDGWERICGSDLRLYRWPRRRFELEEIVILRDIVKEFQAGGIRDVQRG